MTKQVRIENADISNHKVRVRTEQKDADGNWVDVPAETKTLNNPADLASLYIHSHRRLIVEEA